MAKRKILMVCLGNTCRSPIAEAVMIATIKKAGLYLDWSVDSAAIQNWHVGKEANGNTLSVLKKHKLPYNNRARQITSNDFQEFDYILGMDEYNIQDLNYLAPANCKAKIFMLGDFGLPKEDRIIQDPYGQSSEAAFEKCYQQCVVACEAFLQRVLANEV